MYVVILVFRNAKSIGMYNCFFLRFISFLNKIVAIKLYHYDKSTKLQN
jgi:hypothetical protein